MYTFEANRGAAMKKSKVSARATKQHPQRLRDRVRAGDDVAMMPRRKKARRATTPKGEPRGLPDLEAVRSSVKVAGRSLAAR